MSAQDGAPARRLRSLAAHIIPSAASGADGDAPKPKLLYFNSVGKCYGVRMAMFAAFGKDGWEFFNIASFGRGTAAFARRPIEH